MRLGEKYISSAQCRAARALLGWTREELAGASSVSKMTLADFETDKRKPYDRTLRDIEGALRKAGLAFCFDDEDGPGGRGVAFESSDDAPAAGDAKQDTHAG
ncbi:helix-turn-helix transcriptional regulator [Methylobacterium sp. J-078]|uniref:helix-turn-helix domain-containing protein n=1 Tax=Methylobacterium sp. J-078 TaxID=2836657 RepID=UPI001FBBDB8A|nr:helix-turn-helix transcriptional regulator [Methylobacterium sp. J-078]MCJ2045590.1 helix-turn-helix transcriptional regulator [Methylobacterium sp. J-078]